MENKQLMWHTVYDTHVNNQGNCIIVESLKLGYAESGFFYAEDGNIYLFESGIQVQPC